MGLTDTILEGLLYSNLFISFGGNYENDFQFSLAIVSQPCMVQFVIVITEKIKIISNVKNSLKPLNLVSITNYGQQNLLSVFDYC